jgi:hypothetical protein
MDTPLGWGEMGHGSTPVQCMNRLNTLCIICSITFFEISFFPPLSSDMVLHEAWRLRGVHGSISLAP